MGNKPYNRCKKCLTTDCPDREEELGENKIFFYFFSKEKKPYPKEKVNENDWKEKLKQFSRIKQK